MYKEKIIDVETNKETYIDFTANEILEMEKIMIEAEANRQAAQEVAAAKAKERAAILAKLGLTEEEAAVLLF